MASQAHILIVDDEPLMRVPLSDRLRASGYEVDTAESGEVALSRLEARDFDVAVVDLRLPGIDGLAVIEHAKRLGRQADFIVITAFGSIDTAVAAMKLGARDYLTKPFEAKALLEVIERYVRIRHAAQDDDSNRDEVELLHGMIGRSRAMRRLFRLLAAAAASNATVIVQGETGTGKELAARSIHAMSARHEGPFVALNCASIPETLFESELFGVERGAYTGADRRRKGRFEAADGGTFFLDEIDEMPLGPQAKLLRAIQEREIERLGGLEAVAFDVRIVAATKVDLRERVVAGRFREDLYYRLNVLPVTLPPLRERGEDVVLLARQFLGQLGGEAGKTAEFSGEALSWLRKQRFPGNVRELRNLVARAVALCTEGTVEPWHLAAQIEAPNGSAPRPASLASFVRDTEIKRIEEALAETGGHKGRAAELLGISRKTLWEKLRNRS